MGFRRGGSRDGYQEGNRGGYQNGNHGGYQGDNQGGFQGGQQGGGRGRGRGRGRGGGGDRGGEHDYQSHSGLAGLAIKNWAHPTKINPEQAPDQLLSWLSGKSGSCKIVQHQLVGHRQNVLLIWVDERDKDKLLRLNNSKWAGVTLVVEISTRAPPNSLGNVGGFGQQNNQQTLHSNPSNNQFGPRNNIFPADLQDNIVAAIRQSYDEPNKWLKLNEVVKFDAITNFPGIASIHPKDIWDEIFNLCKTKVWPNNHQRNISVHRISLRQNAIATADWIHSLARVFPRLHDLDLGENELQDFQALQAIQYEFGYLEHLILDENPVNASPLLLSTLQQWYPKLKKINNIPIDGSGPMVQNAQVAPVLGTATAMGIGQTPFRPNPQLANAAGTIISVAPGRPPHPEIPADSLFAVETADKPKELLDIEQRGLRVSLATRLNMATTEELLKVHNWDEEKALQEFRQKHASGLIPADRYLPGF